jgi:lysine 6-dehydrogenase
MSKNYAILGAGMQGTCAAYDIARFANPASILMGDFDLAQAERSAARVNRLIGREICQASQVDALDAYALAIFLDDADVLLSCVPYWMHPRVAPIAIAEKCHMLDMGGDTGITWETLKLDEEAREAGISIVPDTGLAPGLVNNLACYFMEKLDHAEAVKMYCGGLPQNPKPPLNYKLVFNIEGLVTEYSHRADVIRGGKVVQVDTLDELENIEVDELGAMEAFTTSGGASTAPYTFEGKIDSYEYKTIRYPGHCERMRLFKDFGFWSTEPVKTRQGEAVPLDVFYNVMGPALEDPADKDLIVVRGIGIGTKDGERVKLQIDILDRHDDATGFTAMERMTGFSTAINAIHVAEGGCPPGAVRYELAMTGTKFLDELQKRGINVRFSEERLGQQPVAAGSVPAN